MNRSEIIPMSEVNLDIGEMVDKIYIGPQGELLQKINNFNEFFGSGKDVIKITNKFRFRPGTYDKLKTAYSNHALRFDMKPRGIYSLRDRIQQYGQWRGREFWSNACEIESRMWQQRNRDNNWVDNTELITEKWNEEKVAFTANQAEFNLQYPENDLLIGLSQYTLNDSDQWNNMKIWIYLKIKDIVITVRTGIDEVIGVIPWGDIDLKWSFNFFSYLNVACRDNVNLNGYTGLGNPNARLFPLYKGISHPYVSRRYNYDSSLDDWRNNTCTGDMDSNLRTAIKSKDYSALRVLCTNWLTRYHIPNTNPLNRIHSCFHGFPEGAHTKLMTLRRDSNNRLGSFNPIDYMQSCTWKGQKSAEIEHSIDEWGVYRDSNDTNTENACDNCQFKSDYSYAMDDGSIVDYNACSFPKTMTYNDPETEEECQWEAGLLLLMCRNLLQNSSGGQYMLSNEGNFPIPQDNEMVKDLLHPNAELDNVLECNPDINLEYFWWKTRTRYPGSHLDVLDFIFKTRLWQEVMDDLLILHYGYEEDRMEDDHDAAYAFREEHAMRSIRELQAILKEEEARNAGWRSLSGSVVGNSEINENMTPEERVIAWAARNGSAINIGESR